VEDALTPLTPEQLHEIQEWHPRLRVDAAYRTIGAILMDPKIKKVTYFTSPTETVKLTRRHRDRKNARQVEFVLTMGQPNYAERKFIRKCLKAGQQFPVPSVQVRYFPRRHAKP
jgi:hypothetical protein